MHLRVYMAEHCWGCDEARAIATQMGQLYAELTVELIDLNGGQFKTERYLKKETCEQP